MTPQEEQHFVDTVTTATLAMKAATACLIAGKPVTVGNCVTAFGAWLNPESPHFEALTLAAAGHVREMIAAADRLSPSGAQH